MHAIFHVISHENVLITLIQSHSLPFTQSTYIKLPFRLIISIRFYNRNYALSTSIPFEAPFESAVCSLLFRCSLSLSMLHVNLMRKDTKTRKNSPLASFRWLEASAQLQHHRHQRIVISRVENHCIIICERLHRCIAVSTPTLIKLPKHNK